MLPLASFTPAMLGICEASQGRGLNICPRCALARCREIRGLSTASAMARKCLYWPLESRFVVIRRCRQKWRPPQGERRLLVAFVTASWRRVGRRLLRRLNTARDHLDRDINNVQPLLSATRWVFRLSYRMEPGNLSRTRPARRPDCVKRVRQLRRLAGTALPGLYRILGLTHTLR